MKYFMTLLSLIALAAPSYAQAPEATSPVECRLLEAHKPDRGVAYQPGVDVHGKAVVPADLGAAPSALPVPQTIVVPLSVDLAQRLQNNALAGLQLEAPLGMLEIHTNGRVVYNGQDLTAAVYPLCGQAAPPDIAPAAAPVAQSGNGQPAADTIKSDAVEIAPVPAVPPDSVVIEGGESREEGYR